MKKRALLLLVCTTLAITSCDEDSNARNNCEICDNGFLSIELCDNKDGTYTRNDDGRRIDIPNGRTFEDIVDENCKAIGAQ